MELEVWVLGFRLIRSERGNLTCSHVLMLMQLRHSHVNGVVPLARELCFFYSLRLVASSVIGM